jgi:hypothetical protein
MEITRQPLSSFHPQEKRTVKQAFSRTQAREMIDIPLPYARQTFGDIE